ncbi:EamA family transporter [soil metagenome]
MDAFTFGAVLFAALLHAGWNAVVKVGLDRFLSITLISLASGVVGLVLTPFVDFPTAAAWPYLLASTALHIGYSLFLIEAYRAGDLGQVYPIARGSAPLVVAIASVMFLGEHLSTAASIGIAILIAGVACMSLRGGRDLARLERRAIAFALGTSLFIAAYTISDAIGARLNGSAHGYAIWLFVSCGLATLFTLFLLRGRAGLAAMRPYWKSGLAGGAMSLGAYWIVIWGMTVAPVALVAALRESSVLFAAAISMLILREPPTRWRIGAAVMIVAGVLLTRVA